jgi:hypothetical protein
MKQPLIGGLIAGKVIELVVGKALDRVAKSPSISLQKPDVPAVREIVAAAVKEELSQHVAHATNTEPAYKSRVSQGSLLIAMTAATDLVRLWQDGIENTPADYATPAVALVGVAWVLYGRFVASKPFGS